MGVEKFIDGDMPNVMKNRGEEGKQKNKRKWKGENGGKHPTNNACFFHILCFMSLGNPFVLIKEFKCNGGTSSTFIH